MLAYLNGKIITRTNSEIIVKTADGQGFLVNVSPLKAYLVNENVEIFVLQIIRESSNDLYGFDSFQERQWAETLLKVSGVGPKMAAMIIYQLGFAQVSKAIAENNTELLRSVKGLGTKTANKIILELKKSVDVAQLLENETSQLNSKNYQDLSESSNMIARFTDVLSNMGYKRGEIVSTISTLKREKHWNESDLQLMLREGLRILGK